ncbi:hypothetical protein [Bradyrhizobium centrosematis]|uniref:hypothetical protein n=1 Tax=Bradyrhizobium centrosematis TaxID=1300039 RepID=UPI00388F3870
MAVAKKRSRVKPGDPKQHNGSLQALIAEVISLREMVAKAELQALNRKMQKAISAEQRPRVGRRIDS